MTRRTWTAEEKLSALDYYHETRSKKRTCRDLRIPCTKMLRDWLCAENSIRFTAETRGSAARRIVADFPRRQPVVSAVNGISAYLRRAAEAAIAAEAAAAAAGDETERESNAGDDTESLLGDDGACPGDGAREDGAVPTRGSDNCIRALLHNAAAGGVAAAGGDSAGAANANPNATLESGAETPSALCGAVPGAAVPLAGLGAMVDAWLMEDCPSFDYGGAVVGRRPVRAVLYAKSSGMLAGAVFFNRVFAALGCSVFWEAGYRDGSWLELPRTGRLPLATVTGPANLVLQGERVALNALAECSGIATAAARVATAAAAAEWGGRLAGTRKTTPGFRLVQKYGMMVGGMDTHRMDLSSMIMLKDNHIAAAGSIVEAVRAAKAVGGFALKIDVECGDFETAQIAAGAGADVVMLDNFAAEEFRNAAKRLRGEFPQLVIEGSGGLTEDTVSSYMCPEADVLSFSINRYATPLDISLKIVSDSSWPGVE
jgi:nicotinate-nucleotide pyrophosphorylase (carboxylating)